MKAACSIVAALALFAGCSTVVIREKPECAALAEALVENVRGESVWTVEGAWKDRPFVAECAMKGDGEKLTVILLAPQMRLATLTLSRPHSLRWERAPKIPSVFDPEYLVKDLALVLLPTDILARSLGDEYSINESTDCKRRTVSDSDDELFSVSQILPDGAIYFRNVRFGYEITVRKQNNAD